MAVLNGYTSTPHHRQNRRRERPGSRTRRTINRKASIQYDCTEGLLDARDLSVPLPSDRSRPSPLLRQNFDKNWQRWKAKQAEEQALAEMDKMQSEQGQLTLFGGDVDDDELYRMGLLYNDGDDVAQNSESNTVLCDVPTEQSAPLFIFREGKPRRSRRRMTLQSLPLYLSFVGLSDDADIAQYLSPPISNNPAIQHRITVRSPPIIMDIPQSLPPSPALAFVPELTPIHDNDTNSLPLDSHSTDWTLVSAPHVDSDTPTPLSEPETWILIDDS